MNLNEHISACCKKAARQLNALARVSRNLDLKSRRTIYNSFIMSNFNYCPLVWHFCGKMNNQKLEKIQERALRILYDDYKSSYEHLVETAGTCTILINRLRQITLTVFKSLHGLNPPCLSDMFVIKDMDYCMRDSSILMLPKRKNKTHGWRSISYLGPKLWNDLPNYMKETDSLNEFRKIMNNWKGPASDMTSYSSYI